MNERNYFQRAEGAAESGVAVATDAAESVAEFVEEELEEVGTAVQRFFAEPRSTAGWAVPAALAGAAGLLAASFTSWLTTYRPRWATSTSGGRRRERGPSP